MPNGIPLWELVGDNLHPERYFVTEVAKVNAACLRFPLNRQQGELLVDILNDNNDLSIRFKRWCDGQEDDGILAEVMSWLIREGVFTA